MLLCYIFLIFLALFDCGLGQKQPLVKTTLGKIRGHHKLSYGNRTFSAFEGIPYAKPPIGDLRFEEPQSVDPWSGIWDATLTHECVQLNIMSPTLNPVGSEDCLYLNVYVPQDQPTRNANLDVVVFIHGGAFMFGSPGLGGPEFLMDRDIVYVTLNYRVGVMGFLSTEDDVVPGNNGMKDQVLALKWIQDHIQQFGGNPNSVTIIGLSAGGAAVHLHYFSSLSKGLFHRGISQSGTALVPWAIQDAPLEMARKLAASIGCDNPSTKELIKCLRQRSAEQVIKNSSNLSPFSRLPIAPFAPVIEKHSETAFLTDFPYKLLSNGKFIDVPWITSITSEEGILCLYLFGVPVDHLNQHWDQILPYYLDYSHTVDETNKPHVAQKIKQFYFEGEKVTNNNLQKLIQLCGDRYFNVDFEKAARMHAKYASSPVYSYVYGYKGERKMEMMQNSQSFGVAHGEDGFLLYKLEFGSFSLELEKLSEPDEKIKEVLVDTVTSFAKDGKPKVKGIEWGPVKNSGDFDYLFIHNDNVKIESKEEITPLNFWHSLPIKENENIVASKDEL